MLGASFFKPSFWNDLHLISCILGIECNPRLGVILDEECTIFGDSAIGGPSQTPIKYLEGMTCNFGRGVWSSYQLKDFRIVAGAENWSCDYERRKNGNAGDN